MTDRPPAERSGLEHNPKTCHICMNPNLHGEQAPDPLELENDRLREQVATLSAERDAARAESDSEREASRAAWRLLRDPDMGGRRFAEAVRILEAAAIRARGAK